MAEFLKGRRKYWSIVAIRTKTGQKGRKQAKWTSFRAHSLWSTRPIGGLFHLHYIFVQS